MSVSACFHFINIFIISLLRYHNNQPGYHVKASIVIPWNSISSQHGGIDSDMLGDIWVSLQLCLDLRHPFSVSLCPGCSIQHVWRHVRSVQTHYVDAVSSFMYSRVINMGEQVLQQTTVWCNRPGSSKTFESKSVLRAIFYSVWGCYESELLTNSQLLELIYFHF